jgi:apolipoprotein N-acyltransferase
LRSLGAGWLASLSGFLVGTLWTGGIPFAAVSTVIFVSQSWGDGSRIALAAVGFFAVDWIHSTWSAGLPWTLLGHSQSSALGVAQLAAVAGVPLISGFLAALNQAAAIAWVKRGSFGSMRRLVSLIAAWGALALLGLPLAQRLHRIDTAPGARARTLLIVQPNVARGERWAENLQESHLAKIVAETERALAAADPPPDAILWPENTYTTPVDRSPGLAAKLQAAVDRFGIPVVLGIVRSANGVAPEHYRNSVLWLAPVRGIVAEIDKTRAFPLIEAGHLSEGASFIARAFGGAGRGKKVEEAPQAGPLEGGFTLSVVLCYEALFPGIVAERRTPESVALVNLADDGWSTGAAATRQLMAFASFRAIEQRLPLVRVAHGGLSLAVDPFGQTLLELPEDTWAHGRVEVRGGTPPGVVEQGGLLALPLVTGLGVWWALGWWSRRSSSSDATPPRGASHG